MARTTRLIINRGCLTDGVNRKGGLSSRVVTRGRRNSGFHKEWLEQKRQIKDTAMGLTED